MTVAEVEPPAARSIEKSIPIPASPTLCGLPVASSVIVTLAARLPIAAGLKVMLIAQFAPAATLDPQVFVCEKSPLFAPVMVMLAMFRVAIPLFVSMMFCAALAVVTNWPAKLSDMGASVTAGAVPVPLSPTLCGLPLALSVMVTEAERAPVAVGLNVTLIEQSAPAASVEVLGGQLFVCEKSPLLAPVIAMLEIVSAAFPLFVTVTFCDALVLPTGWLAKVSGADNVTAGAMPVPVSETLWGLFNASSEIETVALRAPVAVGLNVTLMLQLALTARLLPQLFVCE